MFSSTGTGRISTSRISFVEMVRQNFLTASVDDDFVGFPSNLSKTAKSLNRSRCNLSSTGHMNGQVPIKFGRLSASLLSCLLLRLIVFEVVAA